MKQIFILGASIAYGVGAEKQGWADLIKTHLSNIIYGKNGIGEKIEIYNFSKSDETIDFIKRNLPSQLKEYKRGGEITAIINIGLNNAKAAGNPTNYLCSIDDYEIQMNELITEVKKQFNNIIIIGYPYHNEEKTFPKINPFTGGKSYFSNQRSQLFNNKLEEICNEQKVRFINIEIEKDDWINNYLYDDGIHPNQKGHNYIFNSIIKHLDSWLKE
jgi:lysophospholipase L1-like esterase